MFNSLRTTAVFAALLAAQALPSQAITVGFGEAHLTPYIESGFSIDDARIVGGNCLAGDCMALNKNETSVLTRIGGGMFSLDSFWFQFLGKPGKFTITSYSGATAIETLTLAEADYPKHNGGQSISHLFADITSIVFANIGKGNIRVDNLGLSTPQISPVPLPAALPLLMSGLAALGFAGFRRKQKAV